MPIFFFASVSVIVFYMVAQKALRPQGWWKEIPYLPLLLALGIGMSISNAKAVIEALCNHQTAFVRTPKYGGDRWTVKFNDEEIEFVIFNDLDIIGKVTADPTTIRAFI